MKLTILTDEEQKAEAIRAIVTAHNEYHAMVAKKITNSGLLQTLRREEIGCEWLSLC